MDFDVGADQRPDSVPDPHDPGPPRHRRHPGLHVIARGPQVFPEPHARILVPRPHPGNARTIEHGIRRVHLAWSWRPLNAESEQFSDHEQAGYPGMREAVLPGQCWRSADTALRLRGRVQFVVIACQSGLVRPARLRSLNAVSKDPASALRG